MVGLGLDALEFEFEAVLVPVQLLVKLLVMLLLQVLVPVVCLALEACSRCWI